eukprot:3771035-Pleurochrysis_carterae.AAC.2
MPTTGRACCEGAPACQAPSAKCRSTATRFLLLKANKAGMVCKIYAVHVDCPIIAVQYSQNVCDVVSLEWNQISVLPQASTATLNPALPLAILKHTTFCVFGLSVSRINLRAVPFGWNDIPNSNTKYAKRRHAGRGFER